MSKIAPYLTAILGCVHEVENQSGGPEFDPAVVARARRELRDLLSVVRAARKLAEVDPTADAVSEMMSLDRALARLSRAGRGRGE